MKVAPGWSRAEIDECEARVWDWLLAIDELVKQVNDQQEAERIKKMFGG